MNTTPQQDRNFNAWLRDIALDDQMDAPTLEHLLTDLATNRSVMLVDVRDFFPDAIGEGGDLETLDLGDEYPYVVFSKADPLAVIDSFPDIASALLMCEENGLKYEMNFCRVTMVLQ